MYGLLVLARLANHSLAVQLDAVREGVGEPRCDCSTRTSRTLLFRTAQEELDGCPF